MMKIEHIAIWVNNLELMKDFYIRYFQVKAGEKYVNTKKNFESYFLAFDSGPRLEIMKMPGIAEFLKEQEVMGYTHIAISVGSKTKVDTLTETLRADGFLIAGEPRTTGDGYYESVILDPENNRIELTT
jgi:lactoylglutathione lyase